MDYDTLIEDLYEAYYEFRRHKRGTPSQMDFEAHYETNLRRLAEDLINGSYEIGASIVFGITRPKDREVFAAKPRDRIVHHLIMNKLEPILESEMIHDSYNCRQGKGTFYGIKRLQEHITEISENYTKETWCLSIDMQGFFMSIDKEKCWQMLERVIRDKWTYGDTEWWLRLVRMVVLNRPELNCEIHGDVRILNRLPDTKTLFRSNGKGLPIGNLTSQIFGNYYMTPFDWWSVRYLGKRGEYCRYVDDARIVSTDKRLLLCYIADARIWLRGNLSITLHPKKWALQEVRKGIQFIGGVIKPSRVYTSNRTVTNFFKVARLDNPKDLEAHVQRLNSYMGFLIHNATYAIRYNIYDAIPDGVKRRIVCIGMRKFGTRRRLREDARYQRRKRTAHGRMDKNNNLITYGYDIHRITKGELQGSHTVQEQRSLRLPL